MPALTEDSPGLLGVPVAWHVAYISVAGPTARILGLRRDFIVASVCRAVRRVGTLVTLTSED